MTKLTVKEPGASPEGAPTTAKKTVEVTDALGRVLKVRKLNALNKVDLAQVVGAENCRNEAVMGPSAIAFSVAEINGEAVFQPATWAEMRSLIGRLDDEGLEAVTMAYIEHFGLDVAALEGGDLKN
jgi:hypothetical protein